MPSNNRSPKSVLRSTVAAALLTLVLFAVLNASFVVIEDDDSYSSYYDDDDDDGIAAYSVPTQLTILERTFDVKSYDRFTYLLRSFL